MKLSLTKRFLVLLIPLAIVTVAVGAITWNVVHTMVAQIEEQNRKIELAMNSSLAVSEMSDALKSVVLDPSNTKEADRKMAADEQNVKIIAELAKLTTDDPETAKLIEALGKFDEEKLNPAENQVMEFAKAGKVREAQAHFLKVYLPLRDLYNEMSAALLKRVKETSSRDTKLAQGKINTPIWVLLLGILVFSSIVVVTTRRVSASLQEIVGKLNHGAAELTSASGRISDSGSALSSAATEQAAALQETVTSIDEVSAMVTKNADNSKRSQEVALTSHDAATRGQETVNRMIESIDEISQSNGNIASHVEQSNRELANIVKVISEIGNKTKVINDIVFQTKLLSFNASVEAARAGEHGKGFAVVAEEVGNLAQMSGNAAKEISEMLEKSIQEVEKVVSETKIKIEGLVANGKQKVEVGAQNARACGEVLGEIVNQVGELSRMVGEISTASQEQAIGVREITKAMGQLDQVTQANAQEARSSSHSSDQLKVQASQLSGVVGSLVELVQGGGAAIQAPTVVPKPTVAAAPATLPSNVIPLAGRERKTETAAKPAWRKVSGGDSNVPDENDPRFEDV